MAKKSNGGSGDPRLEGISKKLAKILEGDSDFLDKAQQASQEDLDRMIVESSALAVMLRKTMEEDQDLLDKKELVKEASHDYNEGIKINNARVAYCHALKKSFED